MSMSEEELANDQAQRCRLPFDWMCFRRPGSIAGARPRNRTLPRDGPGFGEMDLSREDRGHAGEATSAEHRASRIDVLPRGEGKRSGNRDDRRPGRRLPDTHDV